VTDGNGMANPHGQHRQPLRTLLATLGTETRALAAQAVLIEDAVAGQPGFGTGAKDALQILQSIDLLVQSLDAVAIFVNGLAQEVDPLATVDPRAAVARIGLRDLAASLAGQARPGPQARVRDTGDVHLF